MDLSELRNDSSNSRTSPRLSSTKRTSMGVPLFPMAIIELLSLLMWTVTDETATAGERDAAAIAAAPFFQRWGWRLSFPQHNGHPKVHAGVFLHLRYASGRLPGCSVIEQSSVRVRPSVSDVSKLQ